MEENIKELIEYPKLGITSKVIGKTEKSEITLFCMSAGTEISEHTSTKEGIIYVIEGQGIFNLEGKQIPMLPNVLITMKKNAIHSLKAEKNTSFLLMLTK